MAKPTLAGKVTLDDSAAAAALRRIGTQAATAATKIDADFAKVFKSLNTVAFASALEIGAKAASTMASAFATVSEGVAKQFEAGRQLQILARQTGAAVSGLVVLQERFKTAGLSADMVGASIARLQKSIAGVENDDNKGGPKMLARLGLNLAVLARLRPDQQLNAVGAAIARIADPAERAGAAMAIFGRSGAQLNAVFSGRFGEVPDRILHQAQLMARNAAIFEQVAIRLEQAGEITSSFYAGVADRVSSTLEPILEQINRIDLVGLGQRFGNELARAGQIFAGVFVLPETALSAIQNGLAYAFTQSGNVLLAAMSAAGKFFQDGMIQGFQAVGESIVSVLMRSFDGPIRYLQAGVEHALQVNEYLNDRRDGKKSDPLGGMSEETRQQQLKQVRRLKDQMEAKGNVVGNPSYREALKYEATLRDYDPSKYAHPPEEISEIMARHKKDVTRFGLYDGGKTADDWQKDSRDSWGDALTKVKAAFAGTKVDDVLGAGRYADRLAQHGAALQHAGRVALGQVPAGPSYDEVAASEVASTNHRPETRPAAYRPETLPHAPGAQTLPATALMRPGSAPSTPVPAAPWNLGAWLGKVLPGVLSPAASTAPSAFSQVQAAFTASPLANSGLTDAQRAGIAASHTVGMGTALDFRPSGGTYARDAFAGFRAANPNDPDQVAAAARERGNYFGTSGGVFKNSTSLTTGGLGGGAYGMSSGYVNNGSIWNQLSGKTNSAAAKTPELGKLTDIHKTLGDLLGVWQGGGSGSGGGGAGATATGK